MSALNACAACPCSCLACLYKARPEFTLKPCSRCGRILAGPENGYVTELSRSSQTVTAGGETWIEVSILESNCIPSNCTCDCNTSYGLLQVGKGRSYTPSPEDVGSSIKCEIVPVDSSSHFNETGAASSASTGRVRPVPLCPQRALVPVPPPRGGNPAGKFTALTYNLLADLYASVSALCQVTELCSHSMRIQHLYSFNGHVNCPFRLCLLPSCVHYYLLMPCCWMKHRLSCLLQVDAHGHCCQQWALSWQYRKQNLLKELLTYKADILCLQARHTSSLLKYCKHE